MNCEGDTTFKRFTRSDPGFHSSSSTFLAFERLDIFHEGVSSSRVSALRFARSGTEVTPVDATESIPSTSSLSLDSGMGEVGAGDKGEQLMRGDGFGETLVD